MWKSLVIPQLPYGGSDSLLGCDGQARGQVHHRLGEQDEKQISCMEEKPQRAAPAPARPSAVRRRS